MLARTVFATLRLARPQTQLWRAQVEGRLNVGDGEEANAVVSLAEDVYGPFSGQACAFPDPEPVSNSPGSAG